ncbi:hypothetical protein ACFSC3_11815 [Sphingomonas floccifaciens]|uniref:DUF533 domain-containing protein n=1 Tax=Sphingomonas floccifaciens TaxID=1844115 RepID=A0ABW4NFF3_9SPHN
MLASLLSALLAQALYGPAAPPPPPPAASAPEPPELSPMSSAAVLRANGMTDAGLNALRTILEPGIARGATRAAQCAVEQLSTQTPLPLGDLTAALHERDATAAAQAAAQTDYLVAALRVLQPADQRVLLSVLGTGGMILGSAPPPRPEAARLNGGEAARRGPGGTGGGLGAGGPPAGERRGPPPAARNAPRSEQPCDMMLDG